MNTDKFILSCISNYPLSDAVTDYSSWLAKNTKFRLKVLHTLIPDRKPNKSDLSGSIGIGAKSELLADLVEKDIEKNKVRLEKGKVALNNSVKLAKTHGVVQMETCLRKGKLIETLQDFENETAITVIGRYGKKTHENRGNAYNLGDHVEKIIKNINSPIFVVAGEYQEPKNAMVLYNGSRASRKVIQFIVNNDAFKKVKIHTVHISDNKEKSEQILKVASNYLTRKEHAHECHYLAGDPIKVAAKYSRESHIDIIVMGAYSHNGWYSKLFGSFTSQVLKECHKPMLLLR